MIGIATVTAPDPLTLVVTTEFPTTLLTQAYVPILPKHIWEGYTLDEIGNVEAAGFFKNEPTVVGTGPYQAVQWEPGEFIKFARNESYWGDQGAADEIIIQNFESGETMVAALKSGEVDYIRGVGANQFAQVQKLVRAEGVLIDHTPPVHVDSLGPLFARADAIAPVVVVGKAAARPAEVGDVQFFKRGDDVGADTLGIGGRRIFADPQAVVDAAAQMLGKMAVDMPADLMLATVDVDDQFGRSVVCLAGWRQCHASDEQER
jgi:hypothetical protein